MSLHKIAAYQQRTRKRNYYDGGGGGDYAGPNDNGGYQGGDNNSGANAAGAAADPEGTADASRADGTAGVEGQGGFGGPGGDGGGGMSAADIAAFVNSFAADTDEQKATDTQGMMSSGAMNAVSGVLGLLGVPSGLTKGVLGKLNDAIGAPTRGYAVDDAAGIGQQYQGTNDMFAGRANDGHEPPDYESAAATTPDKPFGGDAPGQTTALPGATGARRYVWDPKLRQYVLANVGAQDNPMGYSQGQVFHMAEGGPVPAAAGLGAAGQARFVRGGGTGLSDSIPVQMDDGGQGRLGDGEFVIPADVVSGLGGGSSEAGARALYEMMDRIRQQAHGSSEQVKPVDRSAMPI